MAKGNVQPVYRCPKGGYHTWKRRVTITAILRLRIFHARCTKCGGYPERR